MKDKMYNSNFMQSIRIMMGAIIATTVITGCTTTSHRVSEKELEARIVCNYLSKRANLTEKSFEVLRFRANNDLTRLFCIWKEGLVLPGELKKGQKYASPFGLPRHKSTRPKGEATN